MQTPMMAAIQPGRGCPDLEAGFNHPAAMSPHGTKLT